MYPDNPENFEGLEPVTVEQEVTIDPQLGASATICENLDRGPTVTLTQRNTGSIGLVPLIELTLTDGAGSLVATIQSQEGLVAWPGESTEAQIEGLPQLTGGDYLITVTANIVQGLDPIVTEVPFSIGGFGENVAPLCGTEPASTPED